MPAGRLIADLDIADDVEAVAILGRKPNVTLNWRSAFEQRGRDCAAQCGLHHGIDIARIEAVARRPLAVDLDVEIGLAEHVKHAEVLHALDLRHFVLDLLGEMLQDRQITAR